MSYLRYLCLFAHIGVQHCQFLWIVHFVLLLRYSLTFIYLPSFNAYSLYCKLCVQYLFRTFEPRSNLLTNVVDILAQCFTA